LTRKDIPNLISIIRILLIFPVILALLDHQFGLAMVLFAIAGISDALDGFLAKHYHWESRLGSILDPLADKLLLVASFATLTWLNFLPNWLLWLVLGRDIMIITGALAYHALFGQYKLLPLWSSKINTLLQILLVFAVIVQHYADLAIQDWVETGISLVIISVIISGAEYIIVWGRRAWQQHQNN
jgi:cardiolipin synthase (CMP-forming)